MPEKAWQAAPSFPPAAPAHAEKAPEPSPRIPETVLIPRSWRHRAGRDRSSLARGFALVVGLSTLLAAPLPSSRAAAAAQLETLPADTGLNWHVTPEQLTQSCDAAIAKTKAAVASIEATPLEQRTLDNAMLPIENAEAQLNDDTAVDAVLYQLSPDKNVRDASAACNQKVSDYQAVLAADPQIYATAERLQREGVATTDADKQLLQLYVVAGRRSGADLSDAKRAQATALFQKLGQLQRQFAIDLSEDASTIAITKAEAASLPRALAATFKKTSTGYIVPVNESTVGQFMANEESSAAR